MAIYKQVFKKAANNTAAITFGATTALRWATGRLRVRMTEQEEMLYGACNTLRIVNKSSKKLRLHFTWGINPQEYEDIEGNSIRNINIDDGKNFYGFDLESLDTAADVAIGDVNYLMARVQQFKE